MQTEEKDGRMYVSRETRKTRFGGNRFWIWLPLFLALWVVAGVLIVRCYPGSGAKGQPVFETEYIVQITLYTPNAREGIPVPEEDLAVLTEWLGTFTVGERAGDTLIPGSNSVSVELVYEDGSVVNSGLTTVTLGGTTYYMDCGDAPECYLQLTQF